MQILSRKGKALIIALIGAMLITLGASFAVWNGRSARAANAAAAGYAGASVGDTVTFGKYWQRADITYDDKDPIEWIVVDKDERTRQLTLLSKRVLAYCGYFGDVYTKKSGTQSNTNAFVSGFPYNQAWAESTLRAYLNNLERWDLGGDLFNTTEGLSTGRIPSTEASGLRPSIGFSNQKFLTGLEEWNEAGAALIQRFPDRFGSVSPYMTGEIYYKQPKVTDYNQRLARNGFFDEAFTDEEKRQIVPKYITQQLCFRWPSNTHWTSSRKFANSTFDKVWVPSTEELNITENNITNNFMNPNEKASSSAFEYFKNYSKYGFNSAAAARMVSDTAFASARVSAYASIPVTTDELNDPGGYNYWTRTSDPANSCWMFSISQLSGDALMLNTTDSYGKVRPAIILQY